MWNKRATPNPAPGLLPIGWKRVERRKDRNAGEVAGDSSIFNFRKQCDCFSKKRPVIAGGVVTGGDRYAFIRAGAPRCEQAELVTRGRYGEKSVQRGETGRKCGKNLERLFPNRFRFYFRSRSGIDGDRLVTKKQAIFSGCKNGNRLLIPRISNWPAPGGCRR